VISFIFITSVHFYTFNILELCFSCISFTLPSLQLKINPDLSVPVPGEEGIVPTIREQLNDQQGLQGEDRAPSRLSQASSSRISEDTSLTADYQPVLKGGTPPRREKIAKFKTQAAAFAVAALRATKKPKTATATAAGRLLAKAKKTPKKTGKKTGTAFEIILSCYSAILS
jgi:cell division septation protein DedD